MRIGEFVMAFVMFSVLLFLTFLPVIVFGGLYLLGVAVIIHLFPFICVMGTVIGFLMAIVF